MKTKVLVKIINLENKKEETLVVKRGEKITNILKRMEINPEEVIAVLNDSVVPIEEEITEDSKLELVPVVSGG